MKDTLDSADVENWLTLPDETLISAKRQHLLILLINVVSSIFVVLLVSLITWMVLYLIQAPLIVHLFSQFVVLILIINSLSKVIVDWYFHIYLVTNRKIVEIISAPFYSDVINDVFLDQVRTTEIDASITGAIGELLNMGDVTIAFDRPSHDALFVMSQISNPYETALKLGNSLKMLMHASPVWFKREVYPEQVSISEDVYPTRVSVT